MMEIKILITYRWWKNDNEKVKPEHYKELERQAEKRISDMRIDNYVSGELLAEIDGINYRGYWELKHI